MIFDLKKKFVAGFILILILALFSNLNKPNVPTISGGNGSDYSSAPVPIELQPGVTNVRKFGVYYNSTGGVITGGGTAVQARKGATNIVGSSSTPRPLPYPRVQINYSLQTTNSIRGISSGRNNSFILVSVDIRNFGYKYFDADPRKFRLGSLEPILNVSTGNLLDAVVPNNSEAQGDLIFLTGNTRGGAGRLSYVSGEYEIIYRATAATSPAINVVHDFSYE